MYLIACDTDFLIKISNDPLPKFDLAELSKENEFVVMPSVLREIKGLEKSKSSRTARRAKMTLKAIEKSHYFSHTFLQKKSDSIILMSSVEADEELMAFVRAKPYERMIATLDGSLLSRAERVGLPYLTLAKGRVLMRTSQREQHI